MSEQKRTPYARLFVSVFLMLPLFFLPKANALDTALEIVAGYDDNTGQDLLSEDSAFMQYRAELGFNPFPSLSFLESRISAGGQYRDYFQVGDNYRLKAGTEMIFPLKGGRLTPGLMLEASAYRDNQAENDERDDYLVQAYADWIVNARLTLTLRQILTWSDYRNPLRKPLPIHSLLSPGMGSGTGKRPEDSPLSETSRFTEESRSDRLWGSEAEATLFLLPSLQGNILAGYQRLHSSLDEESFRQYHLSLLLDWLPLEQWEFFCLADYSRSDYDNLPPNTLISSGRKDDLYRIGLGLSYFFQKYELRCQHHWEKNESPLDAENYRQNVTQCGITMSF